MGQIEVYEYLKNKRLKGDDDYYSVDEIRKGLKEQEYNGSNSYRNVSASCIQLEAHGYLDVKMTGKTRAWFRLFRLKDKYCKQCLKLLSKD